jgi:hypothetical protein
LTLKDALYRELKYGPTLSGLVDPAKIKMDVRLEPDSSQSEAEYPYLIFRRVNGPVQDDIGMVKETIEIELIGKISSGTKGDDLLEQIKDGLITKFAGHRKTWGKYTANGVADPSGGLKAAVAHLDSTDAFDDQIDEKIQTLTFVFAYLRS